MQYPTTNRATSNERSHRHQLHQEGAMNLLGTATMTYVHAVARHNDLYAEAVRARQLAQTGPAGHEQTALRTTVRRAIGAQMIRTGERIARGTSAAAPAQVSCAA